jgi:Asp-tRNA(Asn)/Glu-tRNA(Gln) amidotransferase A subunit family amidase
MILPYISGHWSICKYKQNERANKIAALPPVYGEPLTSNDQSILSTPLGKLVANIKEGDVKPIDVLHAYGKEALRAHKEINCLTEILIEDAEKAAANCDLKGPLAGIPGVKSLSLIFIDSVSLKDTVNVKGYDACIGYSAWCKKPSPVDSGLIRCIKDAGAIPFVKTNVPTSLLSFESYNDVWGRTTNPHNKGYSPGGSSGGESALLAAGGSIVGIGNI